MQIVMWHSHMGMTESRHHKSPSQRYSRTSSIPQRLRYNPRVRNWEAQHGINLSRAATCMPNHRQRSCHDNSAVTLLKSGNVTVLACAEDKNEYS